MQRFMPGFRSDSELSDRIRPAPGEFDAFSILRLVPVHAMGYTLEVRMIDSSVMELAAQRPCGDRSPLTGMQERGMSSKAEITTYRDARMYWAEASDIVAIPAAWAWKSLDRLLMRIIEIPSSGDKSVKLRRTRKNAPMTEVGNELIARAAILTGVIKASMSMKVTECVPESYLRLDVRTYNMSFAIIDFRMETVEDGCRMTFRQGFRSRNSLPSASAEEGPAKPRQMPETGRIFETWVELAKAIGQGVDHNGASLSGTRNG